MNLPSSRTPALDFLRKVEVWQQAPGGTAGIQVAMRCLNCSVNHGRTLIISPDGIREHVQQHPSDEHTTVQAAWPHRAGERNG